MGRKDKIGFECKIPYGAILIRGLLFFFATGLLLCDLKVHISHPRGLIINAIIKLSRSEAKYFYIVGAVLCFGGVVWHAYQGIKLLLLKHPKCIYPDIDELIVTPGFWSSRQYSIPYSEITKIVASKVQGEEVCFTIFYRNNKLSLYKAFFKSDEDWKEMKWFLLNRVKNKKRSVELPKEKKVEPQPTKTTEEEGFRLIETYNEVKQMLESEDGKKQMALSVRSKNVPWQVSIDSDYGRQSLQKMAGHLSLVFPVDFIHEKGDFMGKSHMCLSPMYAQWKKGKPDFVGTVEMRHVMKYNSKAHLEEGLEFLALAKLVELGFPGFVDSDNKDLKKNYGLIASTIGPPCFRETQLGRSEKSNDILTGPPAYPVVRFKKDDSGVYSIYEVLRRVYMMSIINEHKKVFPAMQWYNFRMFMILLTYIANKSNDLLSHLSMVALEKHTNSFKRDMGFTIYFWDRLEEISTLIESHGFELLLASLCSNNDPEQVRKFFPVISKLPLSVNVEKGFSDEQIIIIINVIEELCKELYPGYKQNIEFGGEFSAMCGNIKIEKGYEITFK